MKLTLAKGGYLLSILFFLFAIVFLFIPSEASSVDNFQSKGGNFAIGLWIIISLICYWVSLLVACYLAELIYIKIGKISSFITGYLVGIILLITLYLFFSRFAADRYIESIAYLGGLVVPLALLLITLGFSLKKSPSNLQELSKKSKENPLYHSNWEKIFQFTFYTIISLFFSFILMGDSLRGEGLMPFMGVIFMIPLTLFGVLILHLLVSLIIKLFTSKKPQNL